MKHRHLLLSIAMVPALAASAHAATLMNISGLNSRNDFTGTIGASFTVGASDLSVTSLGVQDFGDNGLAQNHEVAIWGASAIPLAMVTVLSNEDTLVDHFRYVDIPAVTLLAGQTYFIGAVMTNTGDAWSDGNLTNVSAVSSAVSGYNSTYNAGSTLTKPTTDSGGSTNLRWGPANMQFTVVPEPSAALLGGLGLLALLRRRR